MTFYIRGSIIFTFMINIQFTKTVYHPKSLQIGQTLLIFLLSIFPVLISRPEQYLYIDVQQ